MKFLVHILLFSFCTAQVSHAESNKIIKWVDKNGVTHYGDKPPMPDTSQKTTVLNKEGITVKSVSQEKINHEADEAAAKLTRHDSALLASYNSVEEIDIARDRNTKIDEIALESLRQQLTNLRQKLGEQNKKLAGMAKKKQKIPMALVIERKQTIAEIARIEPQITSKTLEIDAIRKRYDADKVRFSELKPRDFALVDLKNKRKNLAELEIWKQDAQKRVEFYRAESLRMKRANDAVPPNISEGLLSASNELARAEEEITAAKSTIKKNEQSFSNKDKASTTP